MKLDRLYQEVLQEVISQEAISYQGTSSFFPELTAALERLMGVENPTSKELENIGLSTLIQKHTGLKVTVELESGLVNAYVIPPLIDVNSPFTDRFREMGLNKIEDYEEFLLTAPKLRQLCEELRGSVDLGKGRVSGLFSEISCRLVLGTGLWTTMKMPPDEVAAIVLHELGHLFTFFECLTQTATTNMVLVTASQALSKTDTKEQRLQLIFETEKLLDVKIEDPDALASAKSENVYEAVFIRATMDERLKSTHTASSRYDLRSAEFVADQFAVRYGAGRSLAVALSKLMHNWSHRLSTPAWVVIEVLKTLAFIFLLCKVGLLWAIYYLVIWFFGIYDPEFRVYDGPVERIERLRRDTVQVLKDPHLSAEQRKKLLEDIETLDNLLRDVTERRTFFNHLWIALTKHRRMQFSQLRFQQEIEKIVNNDFFVKAQQLKNLV